MMRPAKPLIFWKQSDSRRNRTSYRGWFLMKSILEVIVVGQGFKCQSGKVELFLILKWMDEKAFAPAAM